MILQGNSAQYVVGERVAEAETYRTYLCEEQGTKRQLLLQVAKDIKDNGGLERSVYILGELKTTAEFLETENAKVNPGTLVSYERLFPQVVDSFVLPADQGRRRAVVLSFSEVDDIRQLVPLTNLRIKDNRRVDLKGAAWIMGRLLKLLEFAHDEKITVRAFGGSNVLLLPEKHFALVFDWSSSRTSSSSIPREVRRRDIADAAKAVYAAIGGDPETGSYHYEHEGRFVEFLWDLANGSESNAHEAHRRFYVLVDSIWEKKFVPFTTLPF